MGKEAEGCQAGWAGRARSPRWRRKVHPAGQGLSPGAGLSQSLYAAKGNRQEGRKAKVGTGSPGEAGCAHPLPAMGGAQPGRRLELEHKRRGCSLETLLQPVLSLQTSGVWGPEEGVRTEDVASATPRPLAGGEGPGGLAHRVGLLPSCPQPTGWPVCNLLFTVLVVDLESLRRCLGWAPALLWRGAWNPHPQPWAC